MIRCGMKTRLSRLSRLRSAIDAWRQISKLLWNEKDDADESVTVRLMFIFFASSLGSRLLIEL